ncbi:MAG: lactate racemase domain-containing protein [Candidatus Poribacteria bacterium]
MFASLINLSAALIAQAGVFSSGLPKMVRVRQKFDAPVVEDIPETVKLELAKLHLPESINMGDTVAIAAGSRGIANIDIVVKAIVGYLKEIGAKPYVIPAMGSHGGATAEGQMDVLRHYGITEETVGAPVAAKMEVVQIGTMEDELPVLIGKDADRADHIVVVNRIKSHTDFSGSIESGLMKMLAIGLGKQQGANMYHRAFFRYGFERVIRAVSQVVLSSGRVAFGVGLIENAYGQTAKIAAMRADELEMMEQQLLVEAKKLSGRLPFDELDLLIVDKMGKNISGTGMDTKVIGRLMQNFEPEPEKPAILRIFVRDLTEESNGNACGVGLADFTTTRLVEKIDRRATYMNSITALGPQKVRTPVYYDTDREAVESALETIGLTKPKDCRVVRIESTLHLREVEISESLLPAAQEKSDLEIMGEPGEMEFDEDGNLRPFDART